MPKYQAIENIGNYKIGQEVPEEIAIVWMKMYLKSPVKIVEDKPKVVVEEPIFPTKDLPKHKEEFDFNNDKIVDKKDVKLAARLMGKQKKGIQGKKKK